MNYLEKNKSSSVIIEVKNLDVSSLTEENMDYLCDILTEEIRKNPTL